MAKKSQSRPATKSIVTREALRATRKRAQDAVTLARRLRKEAQHLQRLAQRLRAIHAA